MQTIASALRIYTCATLLLVGSICSFCQQDSIHLSLKDRLNFDNKLFKSDAPLEFTLKFNVKEFQRSRKNENYLPANLYYYANDSSVIDKSVRIKSRGIFRKSHCVLPPFWINTQRIKHKSDSLKVNKKFKCVTHCRNNASYQEFILKEYLVYKIYNILTEQSFKVQLIKVNYIDIGRKNKTQENFGFLIEPIESLAERLESVQVEVNNLGLNYTNKATTDLMCMFAFLIGNADWSITGRHNIKLFKSIDFNKPDVYPVPYDFDYSGFVNATYALPREGTGTKSITERIFLGPCRNIDDYIKAYRKIYNKKDEIEALISGFEYLDVEAKADVLGYLNGFFSLFERNEFIKYHIDIDCITEEEPRPFINTGN